MGAVFRSSDKSTIEYASEISRSGPNRGIIESRVHRYHQQQKLVVFSFSHRKTGSIEVYITGNHLRVVVNRSNGRIVEMISIDGPVHRPYHIRLLLIGNPLAIRIKEQHHRHLQTKSLLPMNACISYVDPLKPKWLPMGDYPRHN